MIEGSEVVHEDHRKCTYINEHWLYTSDQGTAECGRPHPGNDRGEFGMPGLGKAARDVIGEVQAAEYPDKPKVTLWPKLQVRGNDLHVDYGEQGYTVPIATEEAMYAMEVLPDIITKFLERNSKYSEVQKGYDLGPEGIIPDLNRKLGILVGRLWHKRPEHGNQEPTTEVIGDMIGHLLLMLAKLKEK